MGLRDYALKDFLYGVDVNQASKGSECTKLSLILGPCEVAYVRRNEEF
jgi:hypothetical protein